MSTKSSKFLIGLFVIVGLLILAATIIWVGASRILMKGSLYAAYFDESVQGLQVDSAIKYRGVEIGKVQSIDVAPDYRLVEVIMKIDLEGDLQHHTIASLKTAGITGIVFIELDRIKPTNCPIHQNLLLNQTIRLFHPDGQKSAAFCRIRASLCKTSKISILRAFPLT